MYLPQIKSTKSSSYAAQLFQVGAKGHGNEYCHFPFAGHNSDFHFAAPDKRNCLSADSERQYFIGLYSVQIWNIVIKAQKD